ncbi:MAG: penicillin acylase family protein [Candidatus Latescibacteria bacterium]|nr:penicillin acylase family protein [Candidatus Latescibacterota bacterium]
MKTIDPQQLRAALPDLHTTLKLAGLAQPVEVWRDAWGIPHIRAANEVDLYFAQGFATAQDRLWQMDFDRHQALGRWAEWAGEAGLARDRLLRASGMAQAARADLAVCSPEAQRMVEAYARGVNAFIETTQALPVEYTLLEEKPEPWQAWHCLAVYKIRNTLLGSFEPKLFRTRLLKRFGPERLAALVKGYPQGHLLTVPPDAEYLGPALDVEGLLRPLAAGWLDGVDLGSNAWALGGQHTRSGLPLVGGDSHRGLDVPNVYYQIHLACPDFDVIGHAVPGVPGALHFCHNQHVAWGMTHGMADTQDLYVERFREGGREYLFKGQWRPAQVHHETIAVRGAAAVAVEITRTHHGPIIAGDPRHGAAVAIADPGLREATPWLDAVRDAMAARSVADLDQALSRWTDRVNNYAVADTQGHFGYLHAGLIPIRGEANGWGAVPGWTGEHEWQGYIPHAELPRALDPEAGYAVTCNQRVAGADYPYYVGLIFAAQHRARQVQRHLLGLQEQGVATLAEMQAIHAESGSLPARIWVEALSQVKPLDEASARAQGLLRQWDGRMDRNLPQPLIYTQVKACLLARVSADLFGALAGAPGSEAHLRQLELELALALERGEEALLPAGQHWPEVLAQSLQEAVTLLQKKLGPEPGVWRWGQVHHTQPRHPLSPFFPEAAQHLDPPRIEAHGDGDTPLAGGYSHAAPFAVATVSVNRYLFDPSDWNQCRWIAPLGASGHPASPHWADQAQHWADVEYIPQLWDWAQIAAQGSCQQLEPQA